MRLQGFFFWVRADCTLLFVCGDIQSPSNINIPNKSACKRMLLSKEGNHLSSIHYLDLF